MADLYRELRDAKIEVSHSSEALARFPDLYVRPTAEARAILWRSGWNEAGTFTADDGSGVWVVVPFAWHRPLWEELQSEPRP